jgi:hypothetical protein
VPLLELKYNDCMEDKGTKIHIDPRLKADIKIEAAKLSKKGAALSMSDIIKGKDNALKRLKREYPEIYANVIQGVFN